MKKYLLLLVLLLCMGVVSAATKDIRVMNVENCYNLTVRYELSDGEPVGVKFYGCKDWGNQTWFCNCRSDLNSYNLVMQTDSAIVREAREYELEVTGYVYSFSKDSKDVRLLDWGDYFEIRTKNVNDFGEDADCEPRIEIKYINRTVEVPVDKIVEVPVDRIVEVPVNVTEYVYLENITRISGLENESVSWREKAQNRGLWMWILIVVTVGLCGLYFYSMYQGGQQ